MPGVADISSLLSKLQSKDANERIAAADALGRLSDTRAVQPLIEALNAGNSAVREAAASALGKIGDTRAVEPLIASLQDRNRDMRPAAAATALGTLGDPRAVVPLIDSLQNGASIFSGLPWTVPEALGHLGDKRAIPPLTRALGYENARVRQTAAAALATLGEPKWQQWVKGDDADCERLGTSSDPAAVEPLIQMLKSTRFRHLAAEALGRIGDRRAVGALAEALDCWDTIQVYRLTGKGNLRMASDSQRTVAAQEQQSVQRRAVIAALTKLAGQEGREQLIRVLWLGGSADRIAAATALAELGDPKWQNWVMGNAEDHQRLVNAKEPCALTALIPLLGSRHSEHCAFAVRTLAEIGDHQAVDPLIGALCRLDKKINVSAAQALAVLGESRWSQYVKGVSEDLEELGKSGDERLLRPLIGLLTSSNEYERCSAAKGLGHLGNTFAVGPLRELLAVKESSVRRAAAESLGRLGDKNATQALITLLGYEDGTVRRSAAEALAALGETEWRQWVTGKPDDFAHLGASGKPVIAEALMSALAAGTAQTRRAAADGLGALGDSRAADSLCHALGDENSAVRESVARALGALGVATGVQALIRALGDGVGTVRTTAAASLAKLGQPQWSRLVKGVDEDFMHLGE